MSGRDLRVRLIGVDAPEIGHHRFSRGECFGAEAAAALRRLTPPGSVLKVTSDRERRDPYGRELLYAWTSGGAFVNAALIRGGDARAMVVPPNDRFIEIFRAAEATAHQAHLGLWSECQGSSGGVNSSEPAKRSLRSRWALQLSEADPPRITAIVALRSTRLAGTPSGCDSPDDPG
jgi:endonuclease YncB( thermonuclease family)